MKIDGTIIKSKNIPIMYATTVIGGMMFFLPVLALYLEKSLFSATNIAIIFAVEALASVIFEVPTGAISDLFGRKKTLILSYLITLVSFIFLYIGDTMTMFIFYAIFAAFARSLCSGTDHAIIYDSLQEEGNEKHFKKIIGIYSALWPLGASLGSVIGGYIAASSLQLTVEFSFIPILIALILTMFLKEPVFEKESHHNIAKHALESSKVILQNKQLIILLIAFFIMMALGETVHLLRPLFFEYKEIPIEYFGWMGAFVYGFSSLGFYFSHKLTAKFGDKKMIIFATLSSPLFLMMATLLSSYPLIFFWSTASIFFGIRMPIVSHLINTEIPSSKRATILSINQFIGQLGIATVAPFIGYFAELYTIQTAYQISILLMLTVPVILMFLRQKP